VYGAKAQRSEAGEWGVGDCIRGDFTLEEQMPDKDLGRTLTPGYRNTGFADPSRRFGLPSVRIDVPSRTLSMATTMDFGDGTTAGKLVGPSAYAELGVGDEAFLAVVAPGRLRKLFERIGTRMSDAEFAAIYNRAATVGVLTPKGSVVSGQRARARVCGSYSPPFWPFFDTLTHTHTRTHAHSCPLFPEQCIQEFRQQLNEVLLGRDTGEEPQWFTEAMR
jgi:hypothetical protein